jgi:LuxR family maltose regulon positive regulatory protein
LRQCHPLETPDCLLSEMPLDRVAASERGLGYGERRMMRAAGLPPLVTSKVSAPATVEAFVRPQVLETIASGARKRLLVVRAPAGYGKTTVIRFAAQRFEWHTAWYRLDSLDHDPMTFVHGVTESVRRIAPGFGEVVLARLAEAHEVPIDSARATALLVKAFEDELDREVHLVLDDYHEAAASSELNEALRYLVTSAPPHIHFVVLSRYRPTIGITRLQLDGEAGEILYDDLRLDAEAVRELLVAGGVTNVDDATIDSLLELTEGWAASIVLAAQTGLADDSDVARAAVTRPRLSSGVFSFLAEEAFIGLDATTAEFLLRTSCLDSMSPALAAEVSGDASADRLLHGLSTGNAFTFHDPDQDTYRYHHLFRDFLRQRFVRERGTTAFRHLQMTTADAVERAGDPEAAIELLFAANQPEAALDVLERCGDLVTETARLDTLRSWIGRIPPEVQAEHHCALYLRGCIASRDGLTDDAVAQLQRALEACQRISPPAPSYHIQSALEEVHFWRGEFNEAAQHSQQALLEATNARARVHSLCSLGSALRYLGDIDGSEAAWRKAERQMDDSVGDEATRLAALRANALQLLGNHRAAYEEIQSLIDAVMAARPIGLAIPFMALFGDVATETGRLDEADSSFRRAADLIARYGTWDLSADILAGQARLANARGRLAEATAILRPVVESPDSGASPWSLSLAIDELGSTLRFGGDISAAIEHHGEARAILGSVSYSYPHAVTETNLAYSRAIHGDPSALRDLRSAGNRAGLHGYLYLKMRARTLGSIARQGFHRTRHVPLVLCLRVNEHVAWGHIAFVGMELAATDNLGQTVFDAGVGRTDLTAMATKLFRLPIAARALAKSLPERPEAALAVIEAAETMDDIEARAAILEAATRHSSGAVRRIGRSGTSATTRDVSAVALGLTRREAQVLGLMANGQRNPEIAERLFLSEKTVKTHVNRIFFKLGARDRVHAVLLYHEKVGGAGPGAPDDTG